MSSNSKLNGMKRWKLLIILLAMTIIAVSLPPYIRYLINDQEMAGDQPYIILRHSINDFPDGKDELLQSRNVELTPYHHLINILDRAVDAKEYMKFLPLIFAIIFALCLFNIGSKFNIGNDNLTYFFIALILSPAFIYAFFIPVEAAFALCLGAIGVCCLISNKMIIKISSIIFFIVLSLQGFHYSILGITLMLLVMYYMKHHDESNDNNENTQERKIIIGILTATTIITIAMLSFKAGYYHHKPVLLTEQFFVELITGLGSEVGIGLFLLALAIFGFFISWEHKKRLLPIYVTAIAWILLFNYEVVSYLIITLLLAFFASFTFSSLAERKWELKMLKDITLVLLFCGLLFTYISYVKIISDFGPSNGLIEAMDWLEEFSLERGYNESTIFIHHSEGGWVEYFMDKKVMIDSDFSTIPDIGYRYNDENSIYYSRNIETTSALLQKYDVSFIIFEDKLKEEIFSDNKEGLLFLFGNEKVFDKLYYSQGVTLYMFKNPMVAEKEMIMAEKEEEMVREYYREQIKTSKNDSKTSER